MAIKGQWVLSEDNQSNKNQIHNLAPFCNAALRICSNAILVLFQDKPVNTHLTVYGNSMLLLWGGKTINTASVLWNSTQGVYNDIPMNVVVHMLVLLLCIWAAVGSVHGWISCSYASVRACNSSDSKSTSLSLPLYRFPIHHSKSTSCLRVHLRKRL